MVTAIIFWLAIIVFLAALALFAVTVLWVKVILWIVVGAMIFFLLFGFLMNSLWK